MPRVGCEDYLFYQADDGAWLFLQPLHLRMLLAHYGSPAALPATVTAPLVEVRQSTSTKQPVAIVDLCSKVYVKTFQGYRLLTSPAQMIS